MESYKHLFAKQTVARWLAEPNPPLVKLDYNCRRVFVEYPFCLDVRGELHGRYLWDECPLGATDGGVCPNDGSTPSYQECIDAKLLPVCIFDVAVQRKGDLVYAFEIVHKHDLTAEKTAYINRIAQETPLLGVYGLSADWVLSQVKRPRRLKILWRMEWE